MNTSTTSKPIGTPLRLLCEFRHVANQQLDDPAEVTVRIRSPSLVWSVYTLSGGGVVRDSLGQFHFDLRLTEPRDWVVRWEGAAPVEAVTPDRVIRCVGTATMP